MSEKPLKSDNIKVNKKRFQKLKELIDLFSVNVDQIVVSDKFKHNNEGLRILLVTKMDLLDRYALFYLKWGGI